MPAAVIQSEVFAGISGLTHGFTTRLTPAELNASLDAKVSTAQQVHKADFLWPTKFERRTREADGVGTAVANFYVGVYSADCAPVLLALLRGGTPVGVMAVHAGWRGTALGIVEKAVPALIQNCGYAASEVKLLAAIGPCIGFHNFEVSEDVIAAFPESISSGLARPFRKINGEQKYQFDLPGENERQLRQGAKAAGISLELANPRLCTVEDPRSFPSFRRDRESAGRILSYIAFGTDHAQ